MSAGLGAATGTGAVTAGAGPTQVAPARGRSGTRTTAPALQLGVARGIAQLGLALSTIAIARSVGVAGLGRYAFFTAAGSIGVASVASGLAVAGTRDQARGQPWSTSTILRLAPVLVPGAIAVMVFAVVVQGSGAWGAGAAAVMAYAVSGWLSIASALACGAGRYRRAAVGEVAAGIALPVLTIAALAGGAGLVGALVAVGIAAGLGTLLMGPVLHGRGPTHHRTVRSSLPFVFIGIATFGYARLDSVAIRLVGGDVDLGIYSASYRLLGPVVILASAFGSVFFAQLARQEAPADSRTLQRGGLALAAMVVPVAVVEALLAGRIIGWLYGPGFEAAVTPARVLLLATIPLAVYWPVAHALNAAGHERTWATVLAVATLADASLAGWWGSWWGPVGAAGAWVVVETSVAGFMLVRGRQRLA